jgi:hypothetical protein
MLRLAESLDRSRAQLVESITLQQRARDCRLNVIGRDDIELELWAAQRNTGPLERELGRAIRVTSPHQRRVRGRVPSSEN